MCEKNVVRSQVSVHYATHPALLMQISQPPCCPNSNLVPRCPLQRGPFFLCKIEDLKDFNVHSTTLSNSRYKVTRSNLVTYLIRTLMFEWYVIRCGFKNGHQKRDWTTCSKLIIYCRLNIQLRTSRHLYDHLKRNRILTSKMQVRKDVQMKSKIMRQMT